MIVLSLVGILTLASVVTWQATGGDWYTKYEVVEQVESQADQNDPLVAAGFYDGGTTTKTVTRDEFRFGLLPTPAGVFDKHVFSVASVIGPAWAITFAFIWMERRKRRSNRIQ